MSISPWCTRPLAHSSLSISKPATTTTCFQLRHSQPIQNSAHSNAQSQKVVLHTKNNPSSRNLRTKRQEDHRHLWKRKSSSQSGQKAQSLVDTVLRTPSEKGAVYGILDEWVAWEDEFPTIAVAKALQILRKKNLWTQVIQVGKWLLSKGQSMTMGTYELMILAFDNNGRIDEAELLWKRIFEKHSRSVPRALFSRMISMYERNNQPEKLIEIFADMEELSIKPDEDTVKRIARAFETTGFLDKRDEVIKKYKPKWRHLSFKGKQVKIPYDAFEKL